MQRLAKLTISACASAASLFVFSFAASAQSATAPPAGQGRQQTPPPKGPAPKLADGTIDLSGVWRPADIFLIEDITLGMKGEKIPLKPEAEALMKSRKSKEDPETNCLPTGVPRQAPYPWRILQTKTHYFFVFEGNIHSYRQIFMDGRKHPDDPDPTWYGHSIGKWEDDTLVIDTVGFNDRFWFDFVGHPHTEKLHTIERYTRVDLGRLNEDVTIDDPGAYTKPFTIYAGHRLLPNDELMEYICQENERDSHHLVGPAGRP